MSLGRRGQRRSYGGTGPLCVVAITRFPWRTMCQMCQMWRAVLPFPLGQSSVNETVGFEQTFFIVTPHSPVSFLPGSGPPDWIVQASAPMS
jgi:hypothetical protein